MNSRKHSTIYVKSDKKSTAKIELFPAEKLPESAPARFRLHINRRVHKLPDGGAAYLDWQQIAALVAALASGQGAELQPAPDLPRGTSVSVPSGRKTGGVIWRDVTRTATAPIQGYDGRWYVGVTIMGKGTVMVPVCDVIRREVARG